MVRRRVSIELVLGTHGFVKSNSTVHVAVLERVVLYDVDLTCYVYWLA